MVYFYGVVESPKLTQAMNFEQSKRQRYRLKHEYTYRGIGIIYSYYIGDNVYSTIYTNLQL